MTTMPRETDVGTAPVRLNIGGGDVERPGYVNIDRKNGQEAYPLAYDDCSVDEVLASHVLEHVPIEDLETCLTEWVRVLKPGGRLRIAVPDLNWIADQIKAGSGSRLTPNQLLSVLYGGRQDDNDLHHNGWTEPWLRQAMGAMGLVGIQRWTSDVEGECASLVCSLNLEGIKPTEDMREAALKTKITVCATVPRLGFNAHRDCVQTLLSRYQLGFQSTSGAFYGQNMQRALEVACETGCEWILTVDYDTLISPESFERLCMLMRANPEIDALAPVQLKRGDKPCPLFGRGDEAITMEDAEDVAMSVKSAHFGATLLRVSALKRMAKPWFLDEPNADGEWGEGRTDADMYFWRKWCDAGNTVYIAPRVSVGHVVDVAIWPDDEFKPIYQTVSEFQAHGAPEGVRQ